jgi:hypothetical protein
MSYLNIGLKRLIDEISLLMINNYGKEPNKKNFEMLFSFAKMDILESVKNIIDNNKEEVKKEVLKNE